jgi:cellulose synthase/poly-beta-1,6-N-acetylglucosamine synthase-like glycosyltransferase
MMATRPACYPGCGGCARIPDYPRAKLDIKLVVERRDGETLAAIASLGLPARYDVIVAPPGKPSTKPRALNVALPAVRGDFVVVYDAEDEPDPDQLRLAAAHFVGDPGLDCLQARLTIDNIQDSWISKMFAIEYAALFDLIDPGLAALGLPIALGGTSNHFRASTLRRIGGWDAWNVAEDADLGIRLAREGARVGALCSDTLEEAPSDFGAWFRQRMRWQKGWMQTLIVHSRHPVKFVRALGPARALAAAGLIGGSVLGGLFGPALFVEALWRALRGDLAGASAWSVGGDVAIYTLMASGLMAIFVPALAATRRRGIAGVNGALASLPVYCALVSAASWAALFDLAIRPFHWAKTEHGRAGVAARAGVGAPGRPRAEAVPGQ